MPISSIPFVSTSGLATIRKLSRVAEMETPDWPECQRAQKNSFTLAEPGLQPRRFQDSNSRERMPLFISRSRFSNLVPLPDCRLQSGLAPLTMDSTLQVVPKNVPHSVF